MVSGRYRYFEDGTIRDLQSNRYYDPDVGKWRNLHFQASSLSSHGGLRFNPGAKLDASQVEDFRRGHSPLIEALTKRHKRR